MFSLSGGQFLYGDGSPIANGFLELALSVGSATVLSDGDPAPASYVFELDANGVVDAGAVVWGNAELTPAGTYYVATVLDADSNVVWGPINWAVGPSALYAGTLYPDVLVLPAYQFTPAPSGSTAILPPATVSFSATPTFNAVLASFFTITLTGNVTSSTLSGATSGQLIVVRVVQNATGGWTFAWPANFKGGMLVDTTASATSTQMFIFDGTNAVAVGPGTVT